MHIGYILTIIFVVIWLFFEILTFIHNKKLKKELEEKKKFQEHDRP